MGASAKVIPLRSGKNHRVLERGNSRLRDLIRNDHPAIRLSLARRVVGELERLRESLSADFVMMSIPDRRRGRILLLPVSRPQPGQEFLEFPVENDLCDYPLERFGEVVETRLGDAEFCRCSFMRAEEQQSYLGVAVAWPEIGVVAIVSATTRERRVWTEAQHRMLWRGADALRTVFT